MAQLKKILLVDDDDDLREALGEQLLMTEDFDVFEAADGAEAMTKAKEQLYDLMIMGFKQQMLCVQHSEVSAACVSQGLTFLRQEVVYVTLNHLNRVISACCLLTACLDLLSDSAELCSTFQS